VNVPGQSGQPVQEPALDHSLWTSFSRSVRDNVLGEATVQLLRVGGMIALARALTPDDFGLLKVLLVVSVFASVLCEFGLPDAIIQRKDLSRAHETTAWWLNLSLTVVVVTALYLLAPLIAHVMEMRGLTFAIRLMCIPLILEGTAISASARLRRALRFGAIALADVMGEIGFLAGAFILLWLKYPEWSLAGGLAARFVVHALTIWSAEPHVPWGRPRLAAARDLGRFAFSVCSGRFLVASASNADYLLIGRLLGSEALGFYSIAWDLLRFVPDRLYRVVGRVAFPAFSRIQDNDRELASAYKTVFDYVARMVLPVAGCVILAAPEILGSIYGAQWVPASSPMRVLSIGLAFIGLRLGIGSVYFARNYPSFDFYLNGTRLLLIVAAVVASVRMGGGLIAVCASVGVIELFITYAGQYLACVLVRMRLRELCKALLPGLRTAACCMIAVAMGKWVAALLGIHVPTVIVFVTAPPAAVFLWLETREAIRLISGAFGRQNTMEDPARRAEVA
jgi:O-antigen/teichoic acid export membrane protein